MLKVVPQAKNKPLLWLNPCEKKGNLRSFGSTSLESGIVYEGEYSFGSLASGNETWIIRSDGKGVLNTFDVAAYHQNGGIRFMIYVEDIAKMGTVYRFALLS